MRKPSLWISLCFLPFLCHANINKYIYYYDPNIDMVRNVPMQNVAYGSPGWSYEKNNRPNNEERASRFLKKDIVGKNLLDFGCNEGGVLFACRTLGAKNLWGVDNNAWCIEQANLKVKQFSIPNAVFLVGDMENKGLYPLLPKADTVFLLAILDTSNFTSKQAVLTNVARLAKHVLYYEGHVALQSHVMRMYELLMYTDFTRFEYLGRFDGRILIRCSRELISVNDIPTGAVTSDHPDEILQHASEIYVFTDSDRNPPFSSQCRLIQYVKRFGK